MDPLVVLFGLGVGILIGLTGIGGGSLMTPLLILVVGVQPVVAIGTDLAYGAITKTVGGWRHLRSGTVDLDGTVVLALVAGALLIVSLAVLARALFARAPRERAEVPLTARSKAGAVAIGAALGLVLGLTSVGSGALIGPALILLFRLTPRRVVGTDVFHAAIMLWAVGLAHWIGGNVDFALMGTILLGSLPGVWIGTALVGRVPAAFLRPTLGCVLLGSALGVLTKAGVDLSAWEIAGIPTAVGALSWLIHRLQFRKAPEPAWARTS